MSILRKSLATITPVDIDTLIRDAAPESDDLEFKQAIPAKSGRVDPWYTNQGGFGEYGRNELLAEVVGFANSYGGDLLIGIAETPDKPHRAQELRALPQVTELAHRLELAARDCIEPPIPLLQARGIPMQENGAGVVIVRTPRSRAAPHRLRASLQCYRRVRDRTEAMSMREIQDLTFAVARDLQGIDGRLAQLRERFRSDCELEQLPVGTLRLALNVRAVPAAADLAVERVHNIQEIRPGARTFQLTLNNNRTFEIPFLRGLGPFRPILRGSRAEYPGPGFCSIAELHGDGAVSYTYRFDHPAEDASTRRRQHVLYPSWLLSLILNVADTADRFRAFAGASTVEYALEVEIVSAPTSVPAVDLGAQHLRTPLGNLPVGSTSLPRYSLGPAETRAELIDLIWRDYWNAVGVDIENDQVAAVT